MKQNTDQITPEFFFIVLATFFGIIYCLAIPPFALPDEIRHFARIYDIATGNIWGNTTYLSDSIISFADSVRKECVPKKLHSLFEYAHCIKNNGNYHITETDKAFPIWLSSIYTPLTYIHIIPIKYIFLKLNTDIYIIFYMLRILSMIITNFILYKSLKMMPYLKWHTSFILLFTSNIFIRSGISADSMILATCFFVLLKIINNKQKPFNIIITSSLIATMKPIYFLISSMTLTKISIKNITKTICILTIPATISILCLYSTPKLKQDGYTAEEIVRQKYPDTFNKYKDFFYDFYNDGQKLMCKKVSVKEQIDHIISRPSKAINLIVMTDIFYIKKWLSGIISRIDVLDVNTKIPYFVYFALIFMIRNDKTKEHSTQQKIIATSTFFLIKILIMVALYLSFTPVGYPLVIGFQGRYFLPILPLLVFLVPANKKPETEQSQKIRDIACVALIIILCIALASYIKIEYRDHDYAHRYPVPKCLTPPI